MEAHVGPAEPAGGVEPRCEAEAHRGRVDGGRIDSGDAHQRLEARLLRAREATEADGGEGAVLVHERDDVRDRGERDEVGVAGHDGVLGPSRACASLATTPVPQRSGNG